MIALPGHIKLEGETLHTTSAALAASHGWQKTRFGFLGHLGRVTTCRSGPIMESLPGLSLLAMLSSEGAVLRCLGWPQKKCPHCLACAWVPSPTPLRWAMHRAITCLQSHSQEPCPCVLCQQTPAEQKPICWGQPSSHQTTAKLSSSHSST